VDKQIAKQQMAGVRTLLVKWDAIGVADAVDCEDQYDCTIGPLLGHLCDGRDATFLHDRIGRERVEHFGIGPDPSADRALAEALMTWWHQPSGVGG